LIQFLSLIAEDCSPLGDFTNFEVIIVFARGWHQQGFSEQGDFDLDGTWLD